MPSLASSASLPSPPPSCGSAASLPSTPVRTPHIPALSVAASPLLLPLPYLSVPPVLPSMINFKPAVAGWPSPSPSTSHSAYPPLHRRPYQGRSQPLKQMRTAVGSDWQQSSSLVQ